jgi:hypothetical protein
MSRRSDLHPIIKRLHEEDGLTFKEIGAQLGIHLKTAVAAMYREGLPIKEIARQLGYGLNSTPPELTEARRRGLIGYRYSEQRVQNIRKGRWAA